MSDFKGKYYWVKTASGIEVGYERNSGFWDLCGIDTMESVNDLILEVIGEVKANEANKQPDTEALRLQNVTAPLLNYSFRDENGEAQHCQVDAKNAEIMIGNMLEQLNKVNRFVAEFTCNGR